MKKQKITIILGALMIGAFVLSCAEANYFGRLAERTTKNTPENVDKTTTNAPEGYSGPATEFFDVVGTWTQPTGVGSIARPEIVFSIDTSGSMGNEINAIKASLLGWVNQLESQGVLDYCLGVVRAEVNASTTGKLVVPTQSGTHNKACVCTFGENSVSTSTAVTQFNQTLDAALVASGGGSSEAMIYSAYQSLVNDDVLSQNQSQGCFRDDATLVYFLLSDENDSGYAPGNSTYPFDNTFFLGSNTYSSDPSSNFYQGSTDGAERTVRKTYYTDGVKYAADGVTPDSNGKYFNTLTHKTLAESIQAYNGDLPTFGTAIGYVPGDLPLSSGGTPIEDPFWGGLQFAEYFDAPFVNMKSSVQGNQAAFQNSMNAMADALVQAISYYNVFSLSEAICGADDEDIYDVAVEIRVNGDLIDPSTYTINAEGTKITFPQGFPWTGSDQVQITYLACE